MAQPHQPSFLKETANLEAETFVQKQKVALAADVKAVLDSWVRFEQQAKENEQAELARSVIDNVLRSIRDEKTQRDILAGAVAEVERESRLPCVSVCRVIDLALRRTRQEQGHLSTFLYPYLLPHNRHSLASLS